ncbi:MAG TPA: hypothetical protein VF627_15460 [Abditibacterium sp.]|jgi:hypothetical protein
MPNPLDSTHILAQFRELHGLLRDALYAHICSASLESMSSPDRYEGGDIIYKLDTRGEEFLLPFCEKWAKKSPFLLVCEGLPGGQQLFGTNDISSAEFVLICDPIDGTRPLMYDKRSAWFLIGAAPNVENPNLSHIEVALQGELPTSKAGWADCFWATKGDGAHGESLNLFSGATREVKPQPSRATTISGGYAMFSKFFIGSKGFLADMEERLVEGLLGEPPAGSPLTFDDQYISSGGQFYELFSGRDRFNADLRPLAHTRLFGDGAQRLCVHPYDCASELIAREAGVIITDEFGQDLSAPLDVETPVSWIGYANAAIRAQVEPALMKLIHE